MDIVIFLFISFPLCKNILFFSFSLCERKKNRQLGVLTVSELWTFVSHKQGGVYDEAFFNFNQVLSGMKAHLFSKEECV
jgi:hypothetical protein